MLETPVMQGTQEMPVMRYFFKKMSTNRKVHTSVRKASVGIYKNFTIRDSVVHYTRSFEKAILKRKPAGNIKPELVRLAMRKYQR